LIAHARHRIDDDRREGALELRGGDEQRGAHAAAARRLVLLRRLRELAREEVLDGVDHHLAVVVREHGVALGGEPGLEVVAVRDVAVVRPVEERLAAHHVRLGVRVGDGPEGGPAHLAAERAPAHARDAQLVHHDRGRADAFREDHVLVVPLDGGASRVVAAVFQGLQELGGDLAEVFTRLFVDEADHSTHGARF
jgi:hypothetical protein